jgi:hypothetical protein
LRTTELYFLCLQYGRQLQRKGATPSCIPRATLQIFEKLSATPRRCFLGRGPLPKAIRRGKTPNISRTFRSPRCGRERARRRRTITRRAPEHPSPSRYSPSESKTQNQLGTVSELPRIPPSRVHLRYKTAARNHVYGHQTYGMTLFPYTHMTEFRPGAPVQINSLEAPALLPTACSPYGVSSA